MPLEAGGNGARLEEGDPFRSACMAKSSGFSVPFGILPGLTIWNLS